jgi:WD40 repeat protein
MSILYQHSFGQECYCADFSTNEEKPYFAAAFADNKIRVWDYNDFKTAPDEKNKASAKTIDKHLFEIQGKNYGAIDIKINSLANRLAVSSIDSEVAVYNINPERKLEHYRDLSD